MILSVILAAATAAPVSTPAIPSLAAATAQTAIAKKERIARHDPITCTIVVTKIVQSGAWSRADAGCNAPGEGALVQAVFHYVNRAWNLACTHSGEDPMDVAKAAKKCGIPEDAAIAIGFRP